MRVLVALDSFKGSLHAHEAAAAIVTGWAAARLGDCVVQLPMANGGEGTLDVLAVANPGAQRFTLTGARGPDGRPIDVPWLALPHSVAIVESAAACGRGLLAALRQGDLVITSEGQLDKTSSAGKVPGHVARAAR